MADPVHIRGRSIFLRRIHVTTLRDLFTVPIGQHLIIDYVSARAIFPQPPGAVRLDLALQGESESLESQAFVPMSFDGKFVHITSDTSFSAGETVSIHFAPGATLAAVFERTKGGRKRGRRPVVMLHLWGRLEDVTPGFKLVVGGDPLPISSDVYKT